MKKHYVLLALLMACLQSMAAPGDLDPTFDGDGRVTTPSPGIETNGFVRSVAQQSDGKIIGAGLTGISFSGSGPVFVNRLNTDGSPDISFATNGFYTNATVPTFNNANIWAVATYPTVSGVHDDKIVIAGFTTSNQIFVARLLADGSGLDTTFNGTGFTVTTISGGAQIYAVALYTDQTDITNYGKVLVAGFANDRGTTNFLVARYTALGALDTTFNSPSGYVTTNFSPSIGASAFGVALEASGNIVAVGTNSISSGNFALARYNSSGTFLQKIVQTSPALTGIAHTVAVYPTGDPNAGKIIVAGQTSPSGGDFGLARYVESAGLLILDTTFDTDGIVTTSFSSSLQSSLYKNGRMNILTTGELMVSGGINSTPDKFVVAQYDSAGALVSGFGTAGKFEGAAFSPATGGFAFGSCIETVGLTENLVVAGYAAYSPATSNKLAFARYLPTGGAAPLDSTFIYPSGSTDHQVQIPVTLSGGPGVVYGVAIDSINAPNGIIAVGQMGAVPGNFAMTRYLITNGALDTSFGTSGYVTSPTVASSTFRAVQLQTDGKIVAAGGPQGNQFIAARYLSDGSLDTGFNNPTGYATSTFPGSSTATALALDTNSPQRILVAGYTQSTITPFNIDFGIIRLLGTGAPDFQVTQTINGYSPTTSQQRALCNAIALESGGTIMAGGRVAYISDLKSDCFALARFTSAGTLDTTTFNPIGTLGDGPPQPGVVKTHIGTSGPDYISIIEGVALQSDGKIIAAGTYTPAGGSSQFVIARYQTDGNLDTSFNSPTGYVTTSIGASTCACHAVVVLPGTITTGDKDKILAIGKAIDPATSLSAFALALYNPDGSLDTTFGATSLLPGTVITSFSPAQAFATALQPDEKIVAGGRSPTTGTTNFALARYLSGGPTPCFIDGVSASIEITYLSDNTAP